VGHAFWAAILGLGFGMTAVASPSAPAWAASSAEGAEKRRAQKGGKGQRSGGKDSAKAKGDKKKGGKAPPAPANGRATASTAAAKSAVTAPLELKLTILRVTLDNGLRVVLNPDHTSPTVAVAVTYNVGSRNEQRGRSGFAHLFEHMMFQGSRNVDKGELVRLVTSHGGELDGTTNTDRTTYFEILPANELALGLWLEADRMKALDVSETNFDAQRKILQEEYRMRVSNAAYESSAIRLEELVYQGYFPYEHSTIGTMADLDGAKLEWVQKFHADHYGPNNAVLSIAGDFEPEEALRLVHRYFDSAAKIEVASFEDVPFPEQTSQRTAVVRDDHVRTPGILYGWAIPPARSVDHYPLEVAALLLAGGESSRLHQLLVRDKAVVREVAARAENRRGSDLFSIDLKLAEGAKVGDVEKLVEAEIKALATRGPSDAELEKARTQIQARLFLSLQSNGARASHLCAYEAYFGDAQLLNAELPHYFAVTTDDIKRVTALYLGPTRRSIVETYAAEGAGSLAGLRAGARGDMAAPTARVEPSKGGEKRSGKAPAREPKAKTGAGVAHAAKPKKSTKR
jgi:zinc protease